jgi:hypothetical protein
MSISFIIALWVGTWVGAGMMRHTHSGVHHFGAIITTHGILHMVLITIRFITHTVLAGDIVETTGTTGGIKIHIGIEDITTGTFIEMHRFIRG